MLFGTANDPVKEVAALETILRRQVEGLIIEPTLSMLPNPHRDQVLSLTASGIPVVMVHSAYDDVPAISVEVDDVKGGWLVAEHLASLGHRRIREIIKVDDKQGARRLQGLLRGLNEQGLAVDSDWCQFFTTETRQAAAHEYV